MMRPRNHKIANNVYQHTRRWQACTRCPYAEWRHRVVLGRGSVPADVAFIGEAPGEMEDLTGSPFIGPAGKCLDLLIADTTTKVNDALYDAGYTDIDHFTWAINNVVACIPFDPSSQEIQPPSAECAASCKPRLDEWLDMVNPVVVIRLGRVAASLVEIPDHLPVLDLYHPSYLLRRGGKTSAEFHTWTTYAADFILTQLYGQPKPQEAI